MFFGLPLRVTIVTTEPKGTPLCSLAFQSSATRPGVDELGHVGLDGEVHDVGRQAAATLRDWSPDAP